MNQELQYLRNEMNQRISFFYEHSQKTINLVLLIWSGTSIVFGPLDVNFGNMPFHFIGGTIFFISSLILYFSTQRGHDNLNQIFKIAAYTTIFYEKRPNETIKVGDNFSWEIATFEIQAKDASLKTRNKGRIYEMNGEYMFLMMISILGILFFTAMYPISCNLKENLDFILFIICLLYFFSSLFLFIKVRKYSSFKDIANLKIKHLSDFLQYSLETGHYTEKEIEERFGDFWRKIQSFSQPK